jgi:hypothetical protein
MEVAKRLDMTAGEFAYIYQGREVKTLDAAEIELQ